MTRLVSGFGVGVVAGGAVLASMLLSGCAPGTNVGAGEATGRGKQGIVHGGQQPVSGAAIQIYSVGTTGDGSAATPLLTQPVTTDANGGFNIPGFSCPGASTLVYIVATGGNPGLAAGTNNAQLAMMAALGPCGNLTDSSFIFINEVTTVAGVWALAPYMSSFSSIGSGTGDAIELASAFTLASELANTSTGTSPGPNVPAGATVPVSQINTLADILAPCINSAGGVAGDGSACGSLLSATTPSGGTAPGNLIAAALNVASNPTFNVAGLFALVAPTAPFQPALTVAPSDYSVSLVPPALTILPESITFAGTVVGFTSATQTVTLTNTGGSSLELDVIEIQGAGASDFQQNNVCPGVLAPAGSCSIQVVFHPTATGTRQASLLIVSGLPNSQHVVALTGTGTVGSTSGPITLMPSSLTFSQVGVPQTLTLTNYGSTPLAIGGIISGSSYSLTNNCGAMLAAQSICNITVSASALTNGTTTGQLTVLDDAASGPQSATLTTTASVNLSSDQINFGSWAVGIMNVPTQILSVNAGTFYAFAQLDEVSLTGPNVSDFSIVGPNSCDAQYQCTLTIGFVPGGTGQRVATLATNVGNISLTGTGNPPGASFVIAPTNNNLGGFPIQQNLNTTSLPYPFTITNNGSTSLQLGEVTSGPNANEFAVANQCTSSIAPVATCSLSVSFTPTQTALSTASVTVTDSISGAQQTLPVSGRGYYPAPTVTPSTLTFGPTQLGASSAAQTITVNAPNGDPVRVIPYQTGSPFFLDTGSCLNATPCQISVTFRPTVAAVSYLNVTILDEVTQNTNVVSFSGNGGLPTSSLSTSSLAFATRAQGTISIPQTVMLTNNGSTALSISAISLIGQNPGDFPIQSNTCGSSVAVGATCAVSISFDPSATGLRMAVLQISSNSSTSPDLVTLSGTGN